MNRREFLKMSAVGAVGIAAGLRTAETLVRGQSDAAAGALRKKPYLVGADVSWLLEDEQQGATFWDRGVQKDLFAILKSYGMNSVRGRLFVNPHAPGGYSARRDQAFCDLEHTITYAKRAQAAGLAFLLSIHYGDTWTSPGKQAKPAAWANLPYDELVKSVPCWTGGVMKGLKAGGAVPQMVSVGNETSDGLLFADGRESNTVHFAVLINAGCTAVKEFDPTMPVGLHNHLGRDNAAIRKWVDVFLARNVRFDIIGMSCYNEARPGDWQKNFNDIAVRYPQLSFAALEYSYDKRRLNDLIFNAPNAKGVGSFIWEPTRWREAIFDHNGMNAGDDMNGRPHLAASTLPPADAPDQPVYKPAKGPPGMNEVGEAGIGPATRGAGVAAAGTRPTGTRPTGAGRGGRGGKYETNSYMLAYPEMAKAYGLM